MIWLEPVNRDHQEKIRNRVPFPRDFTNGARDKLDRRAHLAQARQQHVQLTKSYKWFATYDRYMEGAMFTDQVEHSFDQNVAFIVRNSTKRSRAIAKMRRLICVATRTFKRTFTGYFDRKARVTPGKYSTPG